MSISSLFQFLIGFFLGIILFTAGIAGGAYFFLTQVSSNPPKPNFSEEKSSVEETPQSESANQTETTTATEETVKQTQETTTNETEDLPEGAYRGKVIWSTGLSLRAEPGIDSERIGGVGYNWEIIILGTSDDGGWQKIRIPSSGQEGWVKAGNIEKID
ncbi:SH3 domain-containing protein [Cyanobacterium sp. Dongsha4]|uniref:SH3 domain-containing protein n=1 Tax=Cyanobacterium sp. DS4 TaxID=2878255 RepID=UPI002E7FEC36|nr:SH3 domain-containing protein [Cyanobacterium sp. Dongsha4]WVL02161.1 SH3 domain-containing protein [Cyanobacterium sp. Dongsha4]